jgi:hypothetical protein
VPIEQLPQTVMPVDPVNFPAAHDWHVADSDEAPTTVLNFPVEQAVQAPAEEREA